MKPGKYIAKALEAQLGMTNGGKEQVAVLFEIVNGEHAGDTRTWYGYFTEKTQERTIQSLRYCGWQGHDLSDLSTVTSNDVELVIDDEEDLEGVMRSKVQWVNKVGGSLALKNQMDPKSKAAFAARMRGLCARIKPEPAQVRKAAPINGGVRHEELPPEAHEQEDDAF